MPLSNYSLPTRYSCDSARVAESDSSSSGTDSFHQLSMGVISIGGNSPRVISIGGVLLVVWLASLAGRSTG